MQYDAVVYVIGNDDGEFLVTAPMGSHDRRIGHNLVRARRFPTLAKAEWELSYLKEILGTSVPYIQKDDGVWRYHARVLPVQMALTDGLAREGESLGWTVVQNGRYPTYSGWKRGSTPSLFRARVWVHRETAEKFLVRARADKYVQLDTSLMQHWLGNGEIVAIAMKVTK